jgi:hypothetical protein
MKGIQVGLRLVAPGRTTWEGFMVGLNIYWSEGIYFAEIANTCVINIK